VESSAGTKVSEKEGQDEAPATGDGPPAQATEEQVVRIPEADQEAHSAPPRSEEKAPPPPAAKQEAPPKEAASHEATTTEAAAPTTRIPTVRKGEPAPKRPRLSPSRLVMGAMLILGGIAWLLDVTNATNINWGVLLSLALVGAGAALVLLGLRGGMNRGLVVLGVILAAILTAAAALRIDIAGGIGSQTVHPVSAKALGKTYRMAVGQMTIDLRHVSFGNGTPKVRATVGVGQLVVLVPPDANVRVHARAGAGMVSAFAKSQSGLDVDHTFFHGSGPPAVILELSVGVGQVTVHK